MEEKKSPAMSRQAVLFMAVCFCPETQTVHSNLVAIVNPDKCIKI
jgi:hypothetical protein